MADSTRYYAATACRQYGSSSKIAKCDALDYMPRLTLAKLPTPRADVSFDEWTGGLKRFECGGRQACIPLYSDELTARVVSKQYADMYAPGDEAQQDQDDEAYLAARIANGKSKRWQDYQ